MCCYLIILFITVSRRISPRWRRSHIRTGFTRSSSFCQVFQRWSSLQSLCTNSSETAAALKKRNTQQRSTKYRSPTSSTEREDRCTNTQTNSRHRPHLETRRSCGSHRFKSDPQPLSSHQGTI